MKYFTDPDGIFEIKIPLEWHYKNEVAGYENKSPFSFELFKNSQGCFQISCYHKTEKQINPNRNKPFFYLSRTAIYSKIFKLFYEKINRLFLRYLNSLEQ